MCEYVCARLLTYCVCLCVLWMRVFYSCACVCYVCMVHSV